MSNSLPSVTNGPLEAEYPVQDPSFALATDCTTLGCTDPDWKESSAGGFDPIDDSYYLITGNKDNDDYSADFCGYESCNDGVTQSPIVIPYGVTSATLAFDTAWYCIPDACSAGGPTQSSVNVGLVNTETSAFYDAYTFLPQGESTDTVEGSFESWSYSDPTILSYVQAEAGQTLTVYAYATTPANDATGWFVDNILLYFNAPQPAPLPGVPTALSEAAGQATVEWSPVDSYATGYVVTTYNSQGQTVGAPVSVSSAAAGAVVTGLTNGTPYYFSVSTLNGDIASTPVFTYSVTPLSGAPPPAAMTAVSTSQYLLPNSDGNAWQVMDEANLAFTVTPSSDEDVLLSANADLWTSDAGFNQDLGIQITVNCPAWAYCAPIPVAWKESGGFAGTFSPNAAFVETVYPMLEGRVYTVQLVWKTNRPAIDATIAAGAGPIGPDFSPTRLSADVLPSGFESAMSTEQYTLPNSDGSTWTEIDPSSLVTGTFSPSSTESVVVSGNADLWTSTAGYNQDLGIFVSQDGGTPVPVAWKESGGFAGTFSPNAAFVQVVYQMQGGHSYTFSLWWKTNKPAPPGATIWVGAGSSPTYSPTLITAYPLPGDTAPAQSATAVSTQQYQLSDSNGSAWAEMDPTDLVTPSIAIGSEGVAETVLVSANADLWTANAGYNQDLGVEVSVDGGTPTLLAWKESGGFAGTFSPNAASVQVAYTLEPGHSYAFSLWWKTNISTSKTPGATIFAAAGLGPAFSPTRISVVPDSGPPPNAPSDVTATSNAPGQVMVSWTPSPLAGVEGVSGYEVTMYTDQGSVMPAYGTFASSSPVTITVFPSGVPTYCSVAAMNAVLFSAPVESNSVTPLASAAPPVRSAAVSTSLYLLPNSDGASWQVLDQANLGLTLTPSAGETVLLTASASLWAPMGVSQDLGIEVIPSGDPAVVAGWERVGAPATDAPDAAAVQTTYTLSGGTTYVIYLVWKTASPEIGVTVADGGPDVWDSVPYSPASQYMTTSLVADVLPTGNYQSVVSTAQDTMTNSDGSTWRAVDGSDLVTPSFSPTSAESVVVSGNADLWTGTAGYNVDLGIMVSEDGRTPTLVTWKEGDGLASSGSPNAVLADDVYAMQAGHTYAFSLWWKASRPAPGATIVAGAGPIDSAYSPTRLTAYVLPADIAPEQWASLVSTQSYTQAFSYGYSAPMDGVTLVTPVMSVPTSGTEESVIVTADSDLWTECAGCNVQLGILVIEDGVTYTQLAWTTSGAGGAFSPNATYVQGVYTMQYGHSYVFSLWWAAAWGTNTDTTQTAGAGARLINGQFSPTNLTVVPLT